MERRRLESATRRSSPDAELQFFPLAEHIMAMPALQQYRREHRWTTEEVDRLIEERPGYTPRYELVDGELLVTAAPNRSHQRLVGDLYVLLRAYVERNRLGEAVFSPATVRLAPNTRFEPDVFVIPAVDGRRPPMIDPVTNLLLAAEVLSPSSARHDRMTKRRFFQKVGLPDYWIVDGEAELFEIWHPADERPALIDDAFEWWPAGAAEPLRVDVARFFGAAADEPR